MDGFETCTRLKEQDKNREVPVIFLTARTDIDSITRAFAVGGLDYLSKPFRSDELLARVNAHVELKRLREKQKEMNRWLEEQVTQRTAELQTANTSLEKANHDLKLLDKAKTEFLRMINHEIRTPLNAILGFTDILKNELKSTAIYEFVQYLDQASVRLEKFLMVVLQITELTTKSTSIQSEEIELRDLISATKSSLKETLSERNIMIITGGDTLNINLHGNKKLLHSCFISILENAIRHSESGSSICIQASKLKNRVCVEFIDEGDGFSEAALSTLFGLFAIGQQHIDQNAGLGLALVKLIMNAHQGEVQISNNPVRGATVRLLFHHITISPTP
jgi:two-component system sensor histidine kinase/response regulator